MFKKIVGSVVVLVLGLILVAAPAQADDASGIEARIAGWQKAFNAGDAGAVAALYTEDASRFPYQAAAFKGRDDISAQISATYELGLTSIELGMSDSEVNGDMAWANGTYVLKDAEGNVAQEGKWMNVSKKVGGKWLIHADIWNTNAPPE